MDNWLDKTKFTVYINHIVMASIKYYPQQPKGKSKIYIRLSIKRGKDFRLSTGLTIEDVKDWNFTKNYPKQNTENNKNLHRRLQDLENHIQDEVLAVEKSDELAINDLSSQWLKNLILDYFNEAPNEDKDLLIPFADSFVKNLPNSTYMKNGKPQEYKQETIDKYKYFVENLKDFEEYRKKKISLSETDLAFAEELTTYLDEEKNQATNTFGRSIKRLKTILKEAENQGRKVNPNHKKIRGFEDETIVTFLTFEEIDKLIDNEFSTRDLEIARDWLVIACYTALRVSDLYRMNKSMIVNEKGVDYIVLKQYKTNKRVKIPIHYKVRDVLLKYGFDFPPNFYENEKSNRTKLSTLMKKVCELSEINEVVSGRYNGVHGSYPKYKLIHNHSCRRSFCCNFYGKEGWSVPMIMAISGHENVNNFYKYIDKEDDTLSSIVAERFAEMEKANIKNKPQSKIIKLASNQ
ncbi:tyrosine-type recombinase/integrase [Myroides fluvii]|uniref:tyrosine-type recombinase/integrase n=1 Tax=Myroides fluvii TaxID=2572594 RepID=UPI00131A7F70|nr:tyrosine-type recombinase/integrase [Myroides fluvii]